MHFRIQTNMFQNLESASLSLTAVKVEASLNPNPIERNSSYSSGTFFTHPNSEHFMCIFNR